MDLRFWDTWKLHIQLASSEIAADHCPSPFCFFPSDLKSPQTELLSLYDSCQFRFWVCPCVRHPCCKLKFDHLERAAPRGTTVTVHSLCSQPPSKPRACLGSRSNKQTGHGLVFSDFKLKQLCQQSGNKHTGTVSVVLNHSGRVVLCKHQLQMLSVWRMRGQLECCSPCLKLISPFFSCRPRTFTCIFIVADGRWLP